MLNQIVSHYRVIEKLGGGGMGVVYRAEDLKLLNVNYTYGKAINFIDNTTGNAGPNGSGNPYIQSQAYLRMNRAPTFFDRTHNLSITNIWDLPFGRGRHWLTNKGVLTQIASGWQVNNVLLMASGHPFNVTGSCDAGWPGNSPTMADIIGAPKKLNNPDAWYDPTAFAQVYDPNNPGFCARRLGNSGFDNLRGPGIFNWDFGVFREFALTERNEALASTRR